GKPAALRPAARRQAAGLGAGAFPVLEFGGGEFAVVLVLEAVLACEGRRVEQAAILVALQIDALPARHLGHLVEAEDQHLAVVADYRDGVAFDEGADLRL